MKKRVLNQLFAGSVFALSLFSFTATAVVPPAPSINARSYILMDYTTGEIIAASNEHEPHGPASLTKVMTGYIIGKELERGTISLTDPVTISERAWARNFPGSSLMFIEVGREVPVSELQKGIIISSGNDASVAMAEHIAGGEGAFADLMNAHAQSIGMQNTLFRNPHGLPAEGQVTTAFDMALLTQALIKELPSAYALHSEREYTYNNIRQYNRNSLLWDRSLNVDGVKTGHTAESGYSLITSATQDGMRLITVVMGTQSEVARAAESKKLLNYGFRFYETVTAYEAGESFVSQRIWGGSIDQVELGVQDAVVVTLPKGQRDRLEANFVLDKPLEAPLALGETVGRVYLTLEGEDIATFPLVTQQAVERGGFFKRIMDNIKQRFSDE
ncbi:D-alanyl-D-alanine carboxypeptidase family protein [Aliidiomarina celeris]|uniref:D-alanyl-D-alanine carboxypeptidase family protein n=1 Tax=Aliidiomarina celeris TaxID=2249428 RepID=UPI000DEB44DC|nr:D-alanyl-D-alanine carboxypeptidase family protein [Aliidiomarina celeris]